MEEEYKKIQNYENYSVSSFGNVRNDVTNKILKPGINGHGYYHVNLRKNSKMNNVRIHRLIATAFIDNPNNKPCVDHVDNNRLHNDIKNLRWCTIRENCMNSSFRNDNSSGVKGVSWHKKTQKWNARIMIDGIQISLGYYDSVEEAANARVKRARQAFGQFINKSEGINHGSKPKKIKKPKQKNTIQRINQIFEEIFKLRDSYKKQESILQKQLLNVLNI
jgi:hypothetical protein